MFTLIEPEEVIKNPRKYSREELINYIKMFAKENGRSPMEKDFKNNPKFPNQSTIFREFGNWNNALKEAGLELNDKIYTREKLIRYLKQFYEENRRIPVRRDFINNNKYPSFRTYQLEFGSWIDALKFAGFEVDTERLSSYKGRLGELQTLSSFKTDAIDLSGIDRGSSCDAICPNGQICETKSRSLQQNEHGAFYWNFRVTERQLKEAEYLFFRAYDIDDFSFPPLYIWRVPIEFMKGRLTVNIYLNDNDNRGEYNTKNMEKYEIKNS